MHRFFIICLSITICSKSNGQVRFNADKSYKPTLPYIINYVDSLYHLEKANDFEFRFIANTSINGKSKVFILSQKDNTWKARYFESVRDTSVWMLEMEIPDTNLTKLWNSLTKNDVLKIPKSENLKDLKGDPLYVSIIHGTVYYFDLIEKGKGRSYSYHCPAGYAKEFPDVKEYQNVVLLINTIFDFCGIKFRIC